MIPDRYVEKVYAGFLGMNIGIRLGAPVEPAIWTYERIRDTYGDIHDYVKPYKNFAADDDANGPVYFFRALEDGARPGHILPREVAEAWLNYTREGVGMFWWGGYGVSTEHTAYLNLKHGIEAPRSGSAQVNGIVLAEQIGGQIFIDTWGLCHPCDGKGAADDAEAAASVSHDGEGLCGARFISACIAEAFAGGSILQVMERALFQIPADSTYMAVVRRVLDFYQKKPDDWRACRQMLEDEWGYDRYPGACHIIPNAGVCALAMAYGKGDFARTVEIAAMCGWDTDCNAGSVGTILGVLTGPEGIPPHYREPINDGLILSGISGYLNNLDIPTYAKQIALWGYAAEKENQGVRMNTEKSSDALPDTPAAGEIFFDFELPGSTHNMRISDPYFCRISHTFEKAYSGKGSLKILVDNMTRGDRCRLYYKPFYSRDEFSDERYSPVLTPTVYPGQIVSMKLYTRQWSGWEMIGIAPYVRTAFDKKEYVQGYRQTIQEEWMDITFTVPDVDGGLIDEVGIVIEAYAPSKSRTSGILYLDCFSVHGAADYTISMKKQKKEFGVITPFSFNHGAWGLEQGKLALLCCEDAFAWAGSYYGKNMTVASKITPLNGDSHLLLVRSQGAMKGYAGGLERDNFISDGQKYDELTENTSEGTGQCGRAVILKNHFGFEVLASKPFEWEQMREYDVEIRVTGHVIDLYIDGREVLQAVDEDYASGMFGCGSRTGGRTYFGDFRIHSD